ncbi:MAG: hypothetical protein HOG49_30370 [Candidatus Scalindua sp.]|jgi:hypothetical protein|nr:hypothetical protein [Candidatus Scalindua sp.]
MKTKQELIDEIERLESLTCQRAGDLLGRPNIAINREIVSENIFRMTCRISALKWALEETEIVI